MTAVVRAHALHLPLRDGTVDLVVTSPPYFALRSYRDGDEHYDGQIGSEPTPHEFLEALWAATREMVRVLKPTGSIWVNLGDKYAGSGGHNNANLSAQSRAGSTLEGGKPYSHIEGERVVPYSSSTLTGGKRRLVTTVLEQQATRRNAPDRYNQNTGGIPPKSLMGLPWRYANGCVDHLGLILRRDLIWHKPNGLPESVTDRCRSSHEYWFQFVKQGRYYSAVDEIREGHAAPGPPSRTVPLADRDQPARCANNTPVNPGIGQHPLGKLPGSVWTIPTEALVIPESVQAHYDLPDHFAAFPQEWPRRLILGWSPPGICVACSEGRRPVVRQSEAYRIWRAEVGDWNRHKWTPGVGYDPTMGNGAGAVGGDIPSQEATIIGYACACTPFVEEEVTRPGRRYHDHSADDETGNKNTKGRALIEVTETQRRYDFTARRPPTRPAVVIDPFGGTGTTAMVARALGRTGLSFDLSADYCRLGHWRVFDSGHAAKSEDRTWADLQGVLF